MMKKHIFSVLILALAMPAVAQQTIKLKSPDGKLEITVEAGDRVMYSVSHTSGTVIFPSAISMELADGTAFGVGSRIKSVKRTAIDRTIPSPFYKKSEVRDCCNEVVVDFREGFSLIFRAYNEGAAYRFATSRKQDFIVKNEEACFDLGPDARVYVPYVKPEKETKEKQLFNSFENIYDHHPVPEWDRDRLAFLPLMAECAGDRKVVITEADLTNYPGMYLHNPDGSSRLRGYFAACPRDVEQGGHNNLQELVVSREDFIARCDARSSFPWRVIAVSSDDRRLLDNDLVYKLASPCTLSDTSWIKPGKVAWEWWNNWNLYGVDFQTGVNNETYRQYIDFASRNGIEYVILDEGWSVSRQADLLQVIPEINLPELVDYGKERNVGIILWAGYYALARDIEGVCRHYSEMGVKGFKIDFMDRDDQQMVAFHFNTAEIAARYGMLVDFHGTYKPTGLQRTFPNVVNFEGVYGLENMKWDATVDQVKYEVTIPFIRMVAGPMDYTQGAMRNANRTNYRAINHEPMSQGTRCRQLAQYVIFEAPLTMLCDSPSNYERESECTNFIAAVPTVWDETVALDGKAGQYAVMARRKGDTWYIGAMTDWNARTIELDLSFIGGGEYDVETFSDGVNAEKVARDYKYERTVLPCNGMLRVEMAPGGGFAARLSK